ncbi:MAG: mechanosensitive ion channel family protein [Hydrogenovibrio sp.]
MIINELMSVFIGQVWHSLATIVSNLFSGSLLQVSSGGAMDEINRIGGLNEKGATVFEQMVGDLMNLLLDWYPALWDASLAVFGGQVWIPLLLFVLLLTFLVDLVTRLIFRTLDGKLKRHNRFFLSSIVIAMTRPVVFYIWLSGSVLALLTMINHFQIFTELKPQILGFRSTLGILAVAWFSVRWVAEIEIYLKQLEAEDRRWDSVTIEALSKIIKLTVFVVTGLFVLSELGLNITGLVAFGGVGAMAVALAGKDIIGNLLGGMMLYWDKPFYVGDWISSPDRSIEGTVESIGWRMTVVRTFDKRPLYIPNGIFSTIAVQNPSRMTHRRISETIGVRYCDVDKVASITADIKKMLSEHPEIDSTQTLIVNFVTYNHSSLDIMVYTFTKTTVWVRFHEVKEDVLLKIAEIIASHNAEIAFPTRTLYVEDSVKVESPGLAKTS